MRQYPGILNLSCSDCEKYHYDIPSAKKILQGGERAIPRGTPGLPGYSVPPCFKCPKIRPDFDEARKKLFDKAGRSIEKNKDGLEELSRKNERCYYFHKEREIFGYSEVETADGWVRENAVIIKMVEKQIDQEEHMNGTAEIVAALYGAK